MTAEPAKGHIAPWPRTGTCRTPKRWTCRSSARSSAAANGIGKATALRLAQDGFDLFLADKDAHANIAGGGRGRGVPGDG